MGKTGAFRWPTPFPIAISRIYLAQDGVFASAMVLVLSASLWRRPPFPPRSGAYVVASILAESGMIPGSKST